LRATFAELAFVIIHYLFQFVNRFLLFIFIFCICFLLEAILCRFLLLKSKICLKQHKTTTQNKEKQRKSKKVCGFLLTKVWFYSIIQNREQDFHV